MRNRLSVTRLTQSQNLTAFYTEGEARAFRETGAMNGVQLWEAEATVAGLVRYITSSPSKVIIEAMHLKQLQVVDRVHAPEGTVKCHRIRLTRRLE